MTTVLLGRDPAHSTTWPEAELILVIDPAKTVSKTHAAIEVEGARLWAHDFGSTNGTKVAKPGTDAIRIPSRGRIELLVGDVLWLGDFAIRIE